MAGALVPISSGERREWEVQYSRFFNPPSLSSSSSSSSSSTCSSLSLLSNGKRNRSRGTWISSSSSTASLKLLADRSTSNLILIVTFREKICERHYISKLHFSWPQVCCLYGFPARGSRAIFVTYNDGVGQIQKFAIRFLSIHESENFVNSLKEILEDERVGGLPSGGIEYEISSQSEFVPSNEPAHRSREDWNFKTSLDTSTHEMPPSLNCGVAQDSNSQATKPNRDAERIFSALPPSFTSLLSNCHTELKQVAAQPTITGEVDLKYQIMKYMEDSSFLDMLSNVEKVISDIGGDLTL